MTELEKAARMALEALKSVTDYDKINEARRALTQALATTEPGFDGSVIVGHSKHRGGWFVFEEFAEGEFTPIKGPFSSKDEADRAMRDPHAPLIQHATTAPDVPETNFGNTTEPVCACGDRPASQCDEEWGPQCDLGNNPKYARPAPSERKGEPAKSVVIQCPMCSDIDPDAGCRVCSLLSVRDVKEWRTAVAIAGPVPNTGMVPVKAHTILAVDRLIANAVAAQAQSTNTSPQAPEGFALVPVEPTEAMLSAVDEEVGGHCHSCSRWRASFDDCRRVWAAMLDAARKGE